MIPYIENIVKFKKEAEKFEYIKDINGFHKKKDGFYIHITKKGNIYCYIADRDNYIAVKHFRPQIKDINKFVKWRKENESIC